MSESRIIPVSSWNPEAEIVERAAEVLRAGGLVAFPTETVYGLGANSLMPEAALKIFTAKGRPQDNPLILHFAARRDVDPIALVTERAEELMKKFWPGPLTLVLPSKGVVPREVTAGLDTIAVRMPSHPVALSLIDRAGFPIAAPSANSSGRPSPTEAQAVADDLGCRVDLILDGGLTTVGVESTVLDLTGPTMILLRPGGCPVERIEDAIGEKVLLTGGEAHRSPGTRYRHYAPSVPLLLDREGNVHARAAAIGHRIAWMGMTGAEPPFPRGTVHDALSIVFTSMENYARGLFHAIRTLEARQADVIVAQWPPSPEGVGRAVQDRLERASSKR